MSWNMLWIKSTFRLPVENREVLIKCRSIVGLGHFNSLQGRFILKDGTCFDCKSDPVEWMDIRIRYIPEQAAIFYS